MLDLVGNPDDRFSHDESHLNATIAYTSVPSSPSPDMAPYCVARAAFSDLMALLNVLVIRA